MFVESGVSAFAKRPGHEKESLVLTRDAQTDFPKNLASQELEGEQKFYGFAAPDCALTAGCGKT